MNRLCRNRTAAVRVEDLDAGSAVLIDADTPRPTSQILYPFPRPNSLNSSKLKVAIVLNPKVINFKNRRPVSFYVPNSDLGCDLFVSPQSPAKTTNRFGTPI